MRTTLFIVLAGLSSFAMASSVSDALNSSPSQGGALNAPVSLQQAQPATKVVTASIPSFTTAATTTSASNQKSTNLIAVSQPTVTAASPDRISNAD